MSAGEVRAAKSVAKKSRRRKKRRTVDVSDSSDSDSSSDGDSGKENKISEVVEEEEFHLTDDEMAEGPELTKQKETEILDDEVRSQLNSVPFTKTELTDRADYNKGQAADLTKVKKSLEEDKQKLKTVIEHQTSDKIDAENKNKYLNLMFENYGEEINSLREAPDFTNKSLVMLANVLKDGTGMFDVETLKTILN